MPSLDKFYTVPEVAQRCIDRVGELYPWGRWGLVVEPSAGNGAFLDRLLSERGSRVVGIDIAPDHPAVISKDFLTYAPDADDHRSDILVIGNPPFGRVSSMAIKFFNHAARWADVVAFIVPRTFRRVSVQNRLDMRFHLLHDEDIPTTPCSFTPRMMAKCCFQVWERRPDAPDRAPDELPTSHPHWDFLPYGPKDAAGQPTPPRGADFAVRAYGGRCGEIVTDGLSQLRPKSWHFVRSHIDAELLMERIRSIDFASSRDTARQNSLGRGELVRCYERLS
jgi:predicted RNA methylase